MLNPGSGNATEPTLCAVPLSCPLSTVWVVAPLVVTALLMDTGTINHTRASHRAVELFYAATLVHIFVWR